MKRPHKIDPAEALAIVGSVFRLVATAKAAVVEAQASKPEERVAIVRRVLDEALDGLVVQVVTALED